ncbi:hypothetical protein [Bauldia sp.]|uniref:hypothetical protein n=1 Tax=Bauldia sp. TaxID=2575872 RepID=UPI003BAAA5B1
MDLGVGEIYTPSLIYGRSFESLFGSALSDTRRDLHQRLKTMPPARGNWIARLNRTGTLNRLAEQLDALEQMRHDGV